MKKMTRLFAALLTVALLAGLMAGCGPVGTEPTLTVPTIPTTTLPPMEEREEPPPLEKLLREEERSVLRYDDLSFD